MTECQNTYPMRGSKKASTFSLETLKTEQCAIVWEGVVQRCVMVAGEL